RGQIRMSGAIAGKGHDFEADREAQAELGQLRDKERGQNLANLQITVLRQGLAITQQVVRLEQTVRQEVLSRLELYNLYEALQQASGNYRATLAGGLRLLENRLRFRQQTAAQVQEFRYKDMAFRIFRNDALQKYRAQFDLAAMYVFLAAKAYDFETALAP